MSVVFVRRFISLALAVLAVLMCSAPVKASDLVWVSGRITTISGDLVPGLKVAFMARKDQTYNSVMVDKAGKFLLQVERGDYSVFLNQQNNSSEFSCINASFDFTVGQTVDALDVVLPNLHKYEFNFLTESGAAVPNVGIQIRRLKYKKPQSNNLKNFQAACSNLSLASNSDFNFATPKGLTVNGFDAEADVLGTSEMTTQATYTYLSGAGQRVNKSLPSEGWLSGIFAISIPDVPTITLNAKDFSYKKGVFTGFATFKEAANLSSVKPARAFRTGYRLLQNGKWTNWTTGTGKLGALDARNRVSVSYKMPSYRGSSLQITVVGNGFTSVNQVITLKIPK